MYYTPYAITEILKANNPQFVNKDGNKIMNEAISFDIETTSMRYGEEKIAFMYVWMLDIFGRTVIGRTWPEFVQTMNAISEYYDLKNIKRRMIVYVHNLAYEFSFIRKWFKWVKVFSLSRRKPLFAVTTTGIEFRCSYRLSGYKLEKIGEMMKIEKLGDFDYSKIRHSRTPLTPREYEYCIHDVKIVTAYIKQKIKEEHNNISEIPLTKTGYVRRYVRGKTIHGNNRCFYKAAIKELTLEPEEYLLAKKAFAGGFTHASYYHASKPYKAVTSFDFGSSYPTVLISEKYPMTKGRKIEHISRAEFEKYMEDEECCIFTIELTNVQQIFKYEHYISRSRCDIAEGYVVDNGRIVSADRLVLNMTSIDYNIIKRTYKFHLNQIGKFYIYKKYYLPTTFVQCILHFFEIKTKLKGVEGSETEYMWGKENLNAMFGMCVTDIVRDIIEYDNDIGWKDAPKMTDDEYKEFVSNQLDKENNKKSRFLFYLWGVFCTAYARKNLWSGIFECKEDYIYSDTDSVKILNARKHKAYFDRYNKEITNKLITALDYHHIPHDAISPKNIKGETKHLGIWEFDGFYLEFKAIRAKSYMYLSSEDKDYHYTIAGLPKIDPEEKAKLREKGIIKKDAIDYLKEHGNPMEQFKYDMKIPAEYTQKLTHSYIDEPISLLVTDYKGIDYFVHELSSTHLEPAEYHLSEAKIMEDLLRGAEPNVYD